MTTPGDDTPTDRSESRGLLPEEQKFVQAGGEESMADELLADSDARTDDPDAGHSGTATSGVTGDDPLVSDTD